MIYIVDGQRDIKLAELDRTEYWNDTHVQGLDGTHYIRFETFADQEKAQYITDRSRLIIQDDNGIFLEFIAHEIVTDSSRILRIAAEGAEYDLDKLKRISPQRFEGYTLNQYAELAISGTGWQVGEIEFASFQTQTFDKSLGGFEFLRRVANYFDRELRFRIEVNGTRIIGRYVDLISRIGADERKEIVAGENLAGIERIVHSDRIITALNAYGPEQEDGSRLYAFVTDEEAFQRWNKDGSHLEDDYEPETDNQDMTLERLTTLAEMALKKRIDSVTEYTIEAAVLPDDDVRLGDTLRIKDVGFNPPLYAEARAIRVERPIAGETIKKTYTIGEIVELEEEDVRAVFRALQNLYGTMIIKQPDKPTPRRNAIWIQTQPVSQFNLLAVQAETFEIPHVANSDLTDWTPITATQAEQIGGVELSKEYNKVSIEKERGLVVTGTEEEEVGNIDGASGNYTMPYFTTAWLEAPNVQKYADYSIEPFTIRVASEASTGIGEPDDNNDGQSWSSPLRTISEALRRIAPQFKGTARILVAYGQAFNEEIDISGFSGGGTLIIERSAETTRPKVAGHVIVENNATRIEWRNIDLDSTDDYAGFLIRNSHGVISNTHINGAAGDTVSGINTNALTGFEILNTRFSNCVTAVRASYGGKAYVENATGEVTGATFVAFGGGQVSGGGTAPTGATATSEIRGGIVNGTWSIPTPPAPPAPVTQQTKRTWSANSDSGTWRSDEGRYDIYGASVNNVTQGAYAGYGPFTGAWFFGAALSTTVTGKQIKSIRLYVGRVSGGSGSGVGVKFRPHTSTSRPPGRVTLQAPEHTASFRVGEDKWITLPSSFHAGFEAGTTKGIAIYSGSTAYAKMKKTAKIEIVYEG